MESFIDWMRHNTPLREGSILLYNRTINNYLHLNDERLDVESINKYISDSVRGKNSYYMKFAFKFYLQYVNQPDLYEQLVKVKIPPRKRLSKTRSKWEIDSIIDKITKSKYADVARLQLATAARARGIITLHENNIDWNFSDSAMKLQLIEKGAKEATVYLSKKYEALLKSYCGNGFLFLPKRARHADEVAFQRIASNELMYYGTAVKKAAMRLGLVDFATHDFRRYCANLLILEKGVRVAQKSLNHSDIKTTMRYADDESDITRDAFRHLQGE